MQEQVFRYEVPVDDQWHTLNLSGEILHVGSRATPNIVEVWALDHGSKADKTARDFRVFGTGQLLQDAKHLRHVGTTVAQAYFVWHLFERV